MGWADYYKAAGQVYDAVFPWWRDASRAAFLATPPRAEPDATGNTADWGAYSRSEIWKRASIEWKLLTGGLPALHRPDGWGWEVAATAVGWGVTPDEIEHILEGDTVRRVKAWALVRRAAAVPPKAPIPPTPPRVVQISKRELREIYDVGETKFGQMVKDGEIPFAKNPSPHAKVVNVDVQRMVEPFRTKLVEHLKLDTL